MARVKLRGPLKQLAGGRAELAVAGATWTPRGHGLPGPDAYLTVLREAFGTAGAGAGLELYFGATSGEVFGSGDAGATWSTVANRLPPVHSVRAAS